MVDFGGTTGCRMSVLSQMHAPPCSFVVCVSVRVSSINIMDPSTIWMQWRTCVYIPVYMDDSHHIDTLDTFGTLIVPHRHHASPVVVAAFVTFPPVSIHQFQPFQETKSRKTPFPKHEWAKKEPPNAIFNERMIMIPIVRTSHITVVPWEERGSGTMWTMEVYHKLIYIYI